ncbi:tetratricopeptide repeat protein [Rummeliibacillus sp. JY-2-4R]
MNKSFSTDNLAEQIAKQVDEETTPSARSYILLAKLFEELKQPKNVKYVLQEGLQLYPANIQLHRSLWKFYTKHHAKNEKILHIPRTVKRYVKKRPLQYFEHLQNVLSKNNQFKTSLTVSKQQLQKSPQDIELLTQVIQQLLNLGHFEEVLPYFEQLKVLISEPTELAKINMKIGMVHMLCGDFEEADKQFAYCREEYADILPEISADHYVKLVIFNNGESSIEFYKSIHPTKRVVATFDAIDKTDKGLPFAYNLLKKMSVDLISLRRRTMSNYHQDLTREDYYQAIEKLVLYYDKRFAYGTSLGGYNALFMGSMIPDIHILAFAPRNPVHPTYGTKERKYNKFTHPLSHPVNTKVQPIVAYDSKERIDNPYITKEIQKSYPNGIYKHYDFAGHRVPTYLRETGVLKEIVRLFLNEKPIPEHDRQLRRKSAEYHRVLGIHCRRHNKLNWALNLANRSIELAPKYDRSLALRIEILIKMKRYDESIHYTKEALEIHPKSARFHLLLADAYAGKGEKATAIEFLTVAKKAVKSPKIKDKLATLKK